MEACSAEGVVGLNQIEFELGNIFARRGDLLTAIKHYREGLEVTRSMETDSILRGHILFHNNLAYHLHLLGDPTAPEYAQAGLSLAQEKGVYGLQTFLYSTLGEIALAASDLDLAEHRFQEGLSLAERFSMQERQAGLTANLGRLAALRGQTSLGIHRLSTALGQADALGTRHLAVQARLWLAPLLPPSEARLRLAEARRLAESSGRERLLQEVERLEAEILAS